MPPSAKMHTTSPAASASLAARSDWMIARGPAWLIDRDDAHHAQDQPQKRHAQKRRPDHEADLAPLRCENDEGIDPADMVGDQQGRSGRGDVLQAVHAQAVQRMAEQPERQTHQKKVMKDTDEDDQDQESEAPDPGVVEHGLPHGSEENRGNRSHARSLRQGER